MILAGNPTINTLHKIVSALGMLLDLSIKNSDNIMRQANVYVNEDLAGVLTEKTDGSYVFCYTNEYFKDSSETAISLTLSKSKKEYHSSILFPFFFNMLSEGVNKQVQTEKYKIDESDYFSLLLATA